MKLKDVMKILDSDETIEYRFTGSTSFENKSVSNKTNYINEYGDYEVERIRLHEDSYGCVNFSLILKNKKECYMNRAIEFVKNKIADLKDDLDHEECVELNELAAKKIKWEIEDFEKVLDCLVNNEEDSYNNSLNFIYDKISVIEDLLLYEEDRVRKYMLKCDLEEYRNIEACLIKGDI